MRKCPICERGEFRNVKDIAIEIKRKLFMVGGKRCNYCNEEFPTEEETKKILESFK